ncbi:CBS domain-containing protein [Pseudoalteromonas distincta]|uniref:CBS domain-containing protein n=1 Tax=Pseudoalteromonas distincta TaxID=77608 RepID=UPI0032E2C0AD
MTQTVSDLMTTNLFTVSTSSTLHDAHNLMKEKSIRHIPVVDENNLLVGILTQKIMIAKVMGIVTTFGENSLQRREKKIKVEDIMTTDFIRLAPSQSLQEVVTFFVENRHGCMPVVDENNKLLGLLTSSDFVKLAARLLSIN